MIDFSDALENKLISAEAEEIRDLYYSLGCPDEPTGPSTDVHVPVEFVDPDYEGFEGLTEDEAQFHADRYNDALEQILELTGVWNAGGDIWHTKWESGSEEWEEYKEKSMAIAMRCIETLWEGLCDSM